MEYTPAIGVGKGSCENFEDFLEIFFNPPRELAFRLLTPGGAGRTTGWSGRRSSSGAAEAWGRPRGPSSPRPAGNGWSDPPRIEGGASASETRDAPPPAPPDPNVMDAPKLTWAVLLGRWVDFARSSLALKDDAAGRRLRQSMSDIIMLQAVWFAVQNLDELDDQQRAVGVDRAQVLFDKHARALQDRFDNDMPDQVRTLIEDAARQIEAAGGGEADRS